jgi:rSAM/selenodomain-associated transferase 2
MPSVSVVIPVYHDAEALARTLARTDWSGAEVIVAATVDDRSLAPLRTARADLVWVDAPRGRAPQMNAGAARARGDWLLFVHADTRLPVAWRDAIDAADRGSFVAGCYRFGLDSRSPFARIIERGVALRVACFRLPYGDQGLFVRRTSFEALGGFADIPIMEDVDFVRRVQRLGRLLPSPLRAETSARRWERDGWIARTIRHLALISLFFCGVSPERLLRLDPARRRASAV